MNAMNVLRKLWDSYSRFITLDWLRERGVSEYRILGGVLLLGSVYGFVFACRTLLLHISYLNRYGTPVTGTQMVVGGIVSLLFGIALAVGSAVFFSLDKASPDEKQP